MVEPQAGWRSLSGMTGGPMTIAIRHGQYDWFGLKYPVRPEWVF